MTKFQELVEEAWLIAVVTSFPVCVACPRKSTKRRRARVVSVAPEDLSSRALV
jgi:hypothetical protein